MKKSIKYSLAVIIGMLSCSAFAQVNLSSSPNVTTQFDHPFLDASSYTDGNNNQNKGLYFPQTNLTAWTFITTPLDGITFPTAYDGMIVYNTGTGNTLADTSIAGQVVAVKPGFYYFYNPSSSGGTSIANGYWRALGGADTLNPWTILGNTGTNPGTNPLGGTVDGNFIGTTDAKSFVIGINNKKAGLFDTNGNIAFGSNPTITSATNSFLVGANNISTTNGVAFGDSNTLGGTATSHPFAFGNSNTVSGNRAFAAGNSNVITGSYATAFGSANTSTTGVSFNYTFLQGQSNTITSSTSSVSAFAKAFGESNIINGTDTRHATAIGQSNQLSALHSFALGYTNIVSGIYAKAFGTFLNTASFNETTFGQYNAITTGSSSTWVGTDAYFQIGLGQSEGTRANALTILKNGNIGTDLAIAPTAKLDIGSGNVRVRDINTNTGLSTDKVVVADATGVLKTVTVASLSPATTNTLTATSGNLVSTVNGVASTPAVPVLISADNGLTAASGNVKLGGALTAATTITTTAANTLALAGLQTGSTADNVVVSDVTTGVLKVVPASTSTAIRTETANYAAVIADETILVDATAGTVTVTLPGTPVKGKRYNIKKKDTTGNTVTVNGNGHVIDDNASISGALPYQGWVLQYDGTSWYVVSRI